MPIQMVKGDVLGDASEATEERPRALAFGADCAGSWTEGVAHASAKRWPALAEAFAARCAKRPLELGEIFTWRQGPLVVYALGISKGGKKPSLAALQRALVAMLASAKADGVARIALPRIGGGKTGLDCKRVKRILEQLGGATDVSIVVFEQFVRAK